MSDSGMSTTELTAQYLAQVTSDLERNTKERERISGEITVLQEQFAALQHDYAVLQNMRQALEGSAATEEAPAESPAEAGVVPAPRKAAGTGKRTRGKAPAAPRGTAKKKQPAKKSAAKAAPAPSNTPTLVELVRRHLTEQKEPRSAAEIAEALGQAHPERGVKTTVVRTTLESLVARNHAQRTKQGTSVFYTAADASQEATTSKPQKEAQPAD